MEKIILTTPEELEDIIRKILKEIPKEEIYLTRHEVCELLHITLPTLHTWTKKGKINAIKIGGRVLYKTSLINESLKQK